MGTKMIEAVELVNTETGEISYYKVSKIGVQGHRIRMRLLNGSLRTVSTEKYMLTTIQENKEKKENV